MNFKNNFTKFMILLLTGFITFSFVSLLSEAKVKALTTTDNVAYKFGKGDLALVNAPTITGQATQADAAKYQWYEQIFDTATDLTSATYLAVEVMNVTGDPGLTIGVMSNGTRFGTYVDSKPIYVVKQDGSVQERSVLYSSISIGASDSASMLLIPMSSLSIVGWGDQSATLSGASSFFFETNAQYNWGFSLKIGQIGYYTNEPNAETPAFTKILDLTQEAKPAKSYASEVTVAWPESTNTTKVEYPFLTDEDSLVNAPTITGQATQADAAKYQWYEQIFDSATDLTSATYLGVEVLNATGNPGLTIGVISNGTRFGSYIDGKPIYVIKQNGTVEERSVLYSSINISATDEAAMLLIPMSSLSIVGWGDQNATLSSATSFFFETNAQYNWGFSLKIGEVGYYTGTPSVSEMTKILDLSKAVKPTQSYAAEVTVEWPEKAVDTTNKESFVFPMRTGSDALVNAPTVKAATTQADADSWQWLEVKFDSAQDLTSATYVGIEIEFTAGNPGLTVGVMSNGTRFGTYADGQKLYFAKEDDTYVELSVLYSSINMGENAKGMLLVPLSALSIVGWGDQNATLSGATSFFFETNAKYNWGFEFKVGEVVVYTGNPFQNGAYTKVLDLTNGVKKTSIYNSVFDVEFPGTSVVNNIAGMTAQYPFRTGDEAFKDAMIWVGTSAGDASDNWQTIRAAFDTATVDLSSATYLAIQYYAKAGNPGLTYAVESNSATRYSISASDGENIYLLKEDGSIVKASSILYGASNVSQSGCLLIPMSVLKYQFGGEGNTLETVTNILFTTNSKYNWLFETGIGEIGFYTGQPCDDAFTFTKLLDLTQGAKDSKFSVAADDINNASTMYRNKIDRLVYGDVKLNYLATGKVAGSMIPWEGGANGEQAMTLDSYGDDAITLTCTGARENADAYTAFTIIDGCHIDWSDAKGVTLWARNDSDTEVSFNLEIDVKHPDSTSVKGRFNVQGGYRFWLYDVVTGEQSIYMTRPCVTLPVGFEGWVRIPFEAFAQAQWSLTDPNYGAFERDLFMASGSYVTYIAITIYSGNYTNKTFAVNKIGGYEQTPSFVSALVPETENRKSIKTLMELE